MIRGSPQTAVLRGISPLMQGYAPPRGGSDEMIGRDGELTDHWRRFAQSIGQLDTEELQRRWAQARQLIHANGVTYNVYGDPRGNERPWTLDGLPAVIAAAEWREIERGVMQRAKLLDLILADVYGPQKLIQRGLLPPALVFDHPGFLRGTHGVAPPADRHLHLYAADMGRDESGRMLVVGDRTQAPSGMGYALENRLVLARTFPEAFSECNVHRLALFFRTLRESLRSLAPANRDNPRIVLLTPGPLNETYFEHAYLARYLGFTLVEGGDLTVRGDRVYLKTLGGLQRVDVILRRQDDDFCDPLELRPSSTLGVAGLVNSWRNGHVAIANSLGSGFAESPALLPYLPALCRALLGEDLRLESPATWWCGDPAQREHVLEHLDALVIKPAFARAGLDPVFGEQLSGAERQRLVDRIRAAPTRFVAQQRVSLSTVPTLGSGGLEPRHTLLRAYAAAAETDYVVMPGGLTRISAAADSLVVSMQKGGGSKDTWVLSDGPVSSFSLLRGSTDLAEISRGGGDLASRVADNLFWLGRYVERAEALVRVIRCILVRLTEHQGVDGAPELSHLLRAVTHMSGCYPGFVGEDGESRLEQPYDELRRIMIDDQRPGSIRSSIAQVRRLASIVRDRISSDTWRIAFALDDEFDRLAASERFDPAAALDLLNRALIPLAAFGGLVMESMTRGLGWTFLDMGRRIERAIQTACLIRFTMVAPPPDESATLDAVLEIAESSMTYRRRYMAGVQPLGVLDLLLADETNPRSVGFQLQQLATHVDSLPGERGLPARTTEQRIVLGLTSTLRLLQLDRLCRVDSSGTRGDLDELLDRMYIELPALSEALSQSYLSHTVSQQLTATPAAPPIAPGRTI